VPRGRLEGQVALVTGGGSGLGLALVQRFLDEGARGVAVLEKSEDKAAALRDRFGAAVCVTCGSAALLADNQRAAQSALQSYERLDTFVGNAGIWDANTSLLDLAYDRIESAFDELFALNVRGYLLGARATAEALLRSGGSMIFTLSNAAFLPGGGGPLYTASKHAGVGLVRQLAYELAPKVRVNGVAPSAMGTDLRGPRSLGLADAPLLDGRRPDDVAAIMPLQIFASAEQYAGTYVWLASRDDAATVTGDVVRADCGLGIRGIRQVAGGLRL
jgi:2,3-dihydroxy-2,3-dihydrophenylpropionate dehydrogenase